MTTIASRQEMKMANYFQAPNEMIDSIVGTVISGNAAWVVMTVWRYTEGMTDKDTGLKRKSAPIPTGTFKRVLDTNRDKTVYDVVKEAVNSGLITVEKQRGKVSLYSINHNCEHWYKDKKVVANSATTQLVAESATSGEKRIKVVANSATGSSGGKCHPYKERVTKEISKEINTKQTKPKKEPPESYKPEKPESVSNQIWNDLLILRKDKKTSNTQTAWTTIFNGLAKAQQETGHTLDQMITFWILKEWKGFNADWYLNAQPKTSNIFQGQNNEKRQPPNSQPKTFDTSTSSGYAAKLDADAERYYAEQARAEQSINRSTENAF